MGVLLEVGEMRDGISNIPAFGRGLRRPVSYVYALKKLVELLLFRNQIGKYLSHRRKFSTPSRTLSQDRAEKTRNWSTLNRRFRNEAVECVDELTQATICPAV